MRMSRLVAAERLPNYQITWWSCVIPNKRGRVSALLEPHQHALARMQIDDSKDHCQNYAEVTNSLTQHTPYTIFTFLHTICLYQTPGRLLNTSGEEPLWTDFSALLASPTFF